MFPRGLFSLGRLARLVGYMNFNTFACMGLHGSHCGFFSAGRLVESLFWAFVL